MKREKIKDIRQGEHHEDMSIFYLNVFVSFVPGVFVWYLFISARNMAERNETKFISVVAKLNSGSCVLNNKTVFNVSGIVLYRRFYSPDEKEGPPAPPPYGDKPPPEGRRGQLPSSSFTIYVGH